MSNWCYKNLFPHLGYELFVQVLRYLKSLVRSFLGRSSSYGHDYRNRKNTSSQLKFSVIVFHRITSQLMSTPSRQQHFVLKSSTGKFLKSSLPASNWFLCKLLLTRKSCPRSGKLYQIYLSINDQSRQLLNVWWSRIDDEPLATKIDLNCLPNKTPIHQIDLTVSDRLHKSCLNANVFSERFVYYPIIWREQNNPQFMPYFIHQILT